MNELYISDLDGTLLGSDAKLSKYTTDTLNKLISDGLTFTIATARARETTMELLADITLAHPIILMNGVLIFDPNTEEFLKVEYLDVDTSKQISKVFKAHNTTGLMYKLSDGETVTHYESLELPQLKAFYDDRTKNSNRKFAKSNNFIYDIDDSVIYFVLIDTFDALQQISADINNIPGVTTTMYHDIYTEDLYFLEVFSGNASKANSALFLKKHLKAKKIIAFGDNYNDISIFKVSDESYAVANSKSELKELATATIASCADDSVANFLKERHTP